MEQTQQTRPTYSTSIRDMPPSIRPRERLRDIGASNLSDAELVAILLRDGTRGQNVLTLSQSVLARFPNLRLLANATLDEMCEINGIGEAKGCQILAALELGKRASGFSRNYEMPITRPEDAYNLVKADMQFLEKEELRALLLNNKHHVTASEMIYRGTVNSASVRVAEILRPAIRSNSTGIIVVHNHPSGDPTPSPEDILVTRRIRQSADMMDIELLDHIIVGERDFVSMKSRQLGF